MSCREKCFWHSASGQRQECNSNPPHPLPKSHLSHSPTSCLTSELGFHQSFSDWTENRQIDPIFDNAVENELLETEQNIQYDEKCVWIHFCKITLALHPIYILLSSKKHRWLVKSNTEFSHRSFLAFLFFFLSSSCFHWLQLSVFLLHKVRR